MTAAVRPYLFYDAVVSICTTCFRKIDGKIVFEDGGVWMLKHCPTHGNERVLMSDDVDYYRACREIYLKPPEMPLRRNTPIRWSCPYDCGLCPDHEQHSCVSLIEVTDACNLRCPICYASSGPERQHHRSLALIEEDHASLEDEEFRRLIDAGIHEHIERPLEIRAEVAARLRKSSRASGRVLHVVEDIEAPLRDEPLIVESYTAYLVRRLEQCAEEKPDERIEAAADLFLPGRILAVELA